MARAATLKKMFFDHKICLSHRSLLIAFEDHHLCQLASCNLANCLLFHHARFHCLHALHGAFHHWLLHRKGHCESKTKQWDQRQNARVCKRTWTSSVEATLEVTANQLPFVLSTVSPSKMRGWFYQNHKNPSVVFCGCTMDIVMFAFEVLLPSTG